MNIPFSEISIINLNELFYTGQLPESQKIELKKQISTSNNGKLDNKEFAKDVSAFANSTGGFLIIGIDEKLKEICGTSLIIGNQKIEDWIANVLNDLIDKTINYELKILALDETDEIGIIILNIENGKDKPYYVMVDKKPIPYIRKGTSVFLAKPADLKEMYYSKSKEAKINQIAKGKNIQQVGQNFGKIINTSKIQNVTEVKYNPAEHITDAQAKLIKDKVDEIVKINESTEKTSTAKLYMQTWLSIKNKFNVTKYTLLPKEKFEECMTWLQGQIAYNHRPKLRKANNPEWKKQIYTAIYSKIRNKKMSKQDLYDYAYEKLNLKKPISSLKDLSDTRLKKLYQHLFSN